MEYEKQNYDIDPLLLKKYVECSTNLYETEEVEKWIKSSNGNLDIARKAYIIQYGTDALINLSKPSLKALHSVNRKINKPRRNAWIATFQRVAAILILPILLFALYQTYSSKSAQTGWIEARMSSGMIGSITLPDSSKVWLNSNTSIKYPTSFNSNSRNVYIDGEAYFSVTKDPEHKFVVHTKNDNVKIEVLGTEFNVDSYSYNDFISATLASGSIKMYYKDCNNGIQNLLMKPNDKVIYNRDGSLIRKIAQTQNDIAWKKGLIILKNTSLKETLWILSKKFNVDFIVQNPKLENASFTGVFKNLQLNKILEYMKIASNINSKIEESENQNEIITREKIILY